MSPRDSVERHEYVSDGGSRDPSCRICHRDDWEDIHKVPCVWERRWKALETFLAAKLEANFFGGGYANHWAAFDQVRTEMKRLTPQKAPKR